MNLNLIIYKKYLENILFEIKIQIKKKFDILIESLELKLSFGITLVISITCKENCPTYFL